MTDTPATTPAELTEEQQKILNDVFQYSDKAEFTPEDLDVAAEMFDTPEKFALLRRILGAFTPNERGISMASAEAFVEASPEDREKYAFNMAVSVRSDETIRQSLVGFYRVLRRHIQDKMKADFEKKNQEDFDEAKRKEDYENERSDDAKNLSEQL